MVDRIGVAILGLGSIGRTHARAILELSDELRLIGATRTTADALAELGATDARVYESTEELLADDDVQVVVITSPSEQHAAQAIAAVQAGKDVVIEKPVAVDIDELATLERAVAETGRFVSVIAQRRLEPQHVEIKRLLDGGALGRVLLAEAFVHWNRTDEYYSAAPWRALAPGGGSMMNQALHSVDLLDWLVGPIQDVAGFAATLGHDIEAEDTAVVALRLASGGLGVIASSTAVTPADPAILVLRTDRGTVELSQSEITRWDFEGVPRPADQAVLTSGAADPAAIGIVGHVAQWRDVISALRTGEDPGVTLADGAHSVRVIAAAYESSTTGRTVRV